MAIHQVNCIYNTVVFTAANVCTFLTYVLPVTMSKKDEKDVIRKEFSMGVRNKKREILRRLDSKTLDAKFLNEIRHGLNCSPFEAEAVLEFEVLEFDTA